MENRYEVIIFWSDDDDAFVAEVPELPGCMAHGASHAEALANAEEAVQLWLETAQELGRPVPHLVEEIDTLRDIRAAERQISAAKGVSNREAKAELRKRIAR
jgi:predicted RNase H-like HicB family nuclease